MEMICKYSIPDPVLGLYMEMIYRFSIPSPVLGVTLDIVFLTLLDEVPLV